MSRRFREVESPRIEERFDYAETVRKQIDRCLQATADPMLYSLAIQALENLIPDDDQDDRYKEERERATYKYRKYRYTYWCGRQQGTPHNPVLHNDPKDVFHYDPSKPTTIKSPIEYEHEEQDWDARFRAAFNLFVRLRVAVRRAEIAA